VKPRKRTLPITTLFVDVGGVLLTDSWDHRARQRAATAFDLVWAEMEAQHHLTFETYEQGKLRLEEYLDLVISTKCDRSPGRSFDDSCSGNRSLSP
jgi:putative hydrolase of the HAD superfamily